MFESSSRKLIYLAWWPEPPFCLLRQDPKFLCPKYLPSYELSWPPVKSKVSKLLSQKKWNSKRLNELPKITQVSGRVRTRIWGSTAWACSLTWPPDLLHSCTSYPLRPLLPLYPNLTLKSNSYMINHKQKPMHNPDIISSVINKNKLHVYGGEWREKLLSCSICFVLFYPQSFNTSIHF